MISLLKLTSLTVLATVLCSTTVRADTTIAYPTADDALFAITVPDKWELTPAEAEDDYFLVTGPTGAELWFRAEIIESGDEAAAAVEEAITSGAEWLDEFYKEVELGEPIEGERDGMPYISVPGKGVDKESGETVVFTIAFLFMENGAMAAFWGSIGAEDAAGKRAAQAIVDSFEAQ